MTTIDFTWTSTTTFTTSDTDFANYSVGDEIEICLGAGSGKVVTITNISYSNPTYTITIDDAVDSATGVSYGNCQKWYELPNITKDSLQYAVKSISQYNKDTQIQIKIIMEWSGANELHELQVVNMNDINSK